MFLKTCLSTTVLVTMCIGAAPATDREPVTPWGVQPDASSTRTSFSLMPQSDPYTSDRSTAIPLVSGLGIQGAAQHVIDQQCGDGGWGWPHDDCNTTYNNITAPIALGLLGAYLDIGWTPALDAATDGGDFDLTFEYTNNEKRFGAFAAYFLWRLTDVGGDNTYSNHAAVHFFDELTAATYGPDDLDTAGWIAAVQAGRSGAWINLRPWEFHNLIPTATAIGNSGQDALFETGLLDGLDTLDNTAPGSVYSDIIGLAGGVRGLAFNGTTTFPAVNSPLHTPINGITSLCDLADVLAGMQNTDGSWYWHSDLGTPGEDDNDVQTTAYATLALFEADPLCTDYSENIRKARLWMISMQDTDGGFFSYPTGDHNTEVESEALDALTATWDGKMTLETDACPDDADGDTGLQIAVELWMRDLEPQPVTGYQAFIEFQDGVLTYRGDLSTYTNDPFPLHIQPISTAEVSPGELRLDGSDDLDEDGTDADSLLATLIFDVPAECLTTSVDFDLTQPFGSELSFEGSPLFNALVNTGDFDLDDTDPLITCPDDIVVPSDAGVGDGCQGATVTYTDPVVSDNCGGTPVIDCDVASGTFFAQGSTTVTCTATDECNNEAECDFDVTVSATNAVTGDVELVGVFLTSAEGDRDRCIHFVTDDCSFADVEITFDDHDGDDLNGNGIDDATEGGTNDPATPFRAAAASFEVPCGNWTQACGKDEQHTLWDTVGLNLVGDSYVAAAMLSLRAGDTDNDGDVDINDVTLLMAQFGHGDEPDGGCPWDGTRGADFSLNDNVFTEDYSMMTPNWLEITECACTPPLPEPPGGGMSLEPEISTEMLDADIARRVDLNRDGVVNHLDVRIFETRHGLSGDLSAQMSQ